VRRLEVFGSAAGDEFDPTSDIDFLVEFQHLHPREHADAYFGMLETLERLLGRHVDLIEVRAVNNPYFIESINRNREVVYDAV
jgi:predicted nucleotidyltransferase